MNFPITPEQSAAWYEAKGVDRENDDERGFCDGCGNALDGDNLCLASACQWET